MAGHPIEGLMTTAMENIKAMVDVNTIVGDAVYASDGTVIIPISRVNFGFAAGGGEYLTGEKKVDPANEKCFAGGSGAGISISPVAFMVVGEESVKMIPINSPVDRAIEMAANAAERLADWAYDKFKCCDAPEDSCCSSGNTPTDTSGAEQEEQPDVQMNTNAEL